MKPVDLLISFDTTGSMYPCISEVRTRVGEFVGQMFSSMPDLRIGIVSHGDYCDGEEDWLNFNPFTNNPKVATRRVKDAPRTHGGDAPEAYEAVLQAARTQANWRVDAAKILVMIGDSIPHENNLGNRVESNRGISWKEQVQLNEADGIQTYAVQCMGRSAANYFWKGIVTNNGVHVRLDQFLDIVELLLAVPHHNNGTLDQWEVDMRAGLKWNRRMADILAQFGKEDTHHADEFEARGLDPVEPTRFQMLTVDATGSIKDFVIRSGAEFKIGRGFYQLFNKPVLVQERKEVVLLDEKSGDMYTGDEARRMIGLPYGSRGKVYPSTLLGLGYTVFIQSTSSNRKLFEGSRFLYEV